MGMLGDTSLMVKALLVLLLTALVVRVAQWWMAYRQRFKFFNSLPGPKEFNPFLGNIHTFYHPDPEVRIAKCREWVESFPKYLRIWVGPLKPTLSVHHPDTVSVLFKTPGIDSYKNFGYSLAEDWLGPGLLFGSGKIWARSRRLLTPAFHFDILKPYVDVSNTGAQLLMNVFTRHAATKKSLEITGPVSRCTLDVILRCAMSYDGGIQTDGETNPFVVAVDELTKLWFDRGFNPLYHSSFVYYMTPAGRRFKKHTQYVHHLAESIIRARKETLDAGRVEKKRYLDFLDLLLEARDENGEGMTLTEIRNEVDNFMFAGHDTTASAISWALYELACHPEYQRKVQAEVDEILQGRDSDHLYWNDLSKMEYLNRVMKETMRKHSTVPFIFRQLIKPVELEGVTIPAGTEVAIHIFMLHHHHKVWPDPDTFDPDRFLPENSKGRHPYAYVPFAAGARNCIGQHFALNEQKVVLGRLLRKFDLSVDKSHVVKRRVAATLRANNGIKLFATPRHHS